MKLVRVPIILLVLLLGFSLAPNVVLAKDSTESDDQTQEQATQTAKELEQERKDAAEKRIEAAKEALKKASDAEKKLAEGFMKACENHKMAFETRFANLANHSQTIVDVMDKIAARVEAFKTSKNLTVANYDALVADVAAKQLIVHNLQATAKQDAAQDFNCDRDKAHESVQSFTDLLHQQIDALKNYKTSVKNLIVAVKKAASAATSTEGTSNATN